MYTARISLFEFLFDTIVYKNESLGYTPAINYSWTLQAVSYLSGKELSNTRQPVYHIIHFPVPPCTLPRLNLTDFT